LIDIILDYSIDHAGPFIAILSTVVVTTLGTAIWIYGKYHERAMRRRETRAAN